MPTSDLEMTGSDEGIWTPHRRELRDWLHRNAESLAELYEGAVRLVSSDHLPGRVRFICHAVREIRNRLPDAICGTRGGKNLQYKNEIDSLATEWKRAGLMVEEVSAKALHPDESGEQGPATIAVPADIVFGINKLFLDHEAVREKPVEAATRLYEELAPENEAHPELMRPIIRHWVDATNWFVRRAHDSGQPDSHYRPEELQHRFEVFERSLLALISSFYTALDELDALLEEANA